MPRPSLPDTLAAIPDLLLAGTALVTWIDPAILGAEKVHYFVLLMLLEFIVVHSAGFMGVVAYGKASRAARGAAMLGFALFYTLFVGAFSLSFHEWWPLIAFWVLVINRLAGALLGQASDENTRGLVRAGWAAGVAFYLLAAFATILIPIPTLGITPEVVAAQHFPGSGLWIEQPWRTVAMATLYFGLQGWWSLVGYRRVERLAGGAGRAGGG